MQSRCAVCGLYGTLEGAVRRVVPANHHLVSMRMWHWGGRKFRHSRRWSFQYRCMRCGYRWWL